MSAGYGAGVGLSGTIRRLAVLILLFWVGLAAITNAVVPRLEEVAKQHNVAMSPGDAPSMQAMKRIGEAFHEFDSDNAAMIVLRVTSRCARTRTATTTPWSSSWPRTPNTWSMSRTSGATR